MSTETATIPAFDSDATLLSQYANSPVITALVDYMSQWFDPSANMESFYSLFWNISSAQGVGLDNWGRILNVSRYVPIPNQQQYFGFAGSSWTGFNVAPFYSGGSSSSLFPLPDATYLLLLMAKAFVNISRITAQSLNQMLQSVFGAGAVCVLDLGAMQMAYVFATSPTAVNLAIVQSSGVFPHPSGVAASVRTALLFNAQLVAATSGSDVGFGSGFGSLTPSTDTNGNTVVSLYTASGSVVLTVSSTSTLTATYFNDLTVNGVSIAASAATFSSAGSDYTWTWSSESALAMTSGDTYTILIS